MGHQNFGGDIIIPSGPHEPKLDGNEDSLLCLIKLICIELGSCEVRRLTRALSNAFASEDEIEDEIHD